MKKLGWVILDADGDLSAPFVYETRSDAKECAKEFDYDRSHYHAPYSVEKVYLKGKK